MNNRISWPPFEMTRIIMMSLLFLLATQKTANARGIERRSSECSSHSDCAADSDICHNGLCVHFQSVPREACDGQFKKYCTHDVQCACAEDSLICQDNECVLSRLNNIPFGQPCTNHHDCVSIEVCVNNTCQTAKTEKELKELERILSLIQQSKRKRYCADDNGCPSGMTCQGNKCSKEKQVVSGGDTFKREESCKDHSECPWDYYCHRNECLKRNLPAVHLAICLLNNKNAICYNDADCRQCGSIKFTCSFSNDGTGKCTP